MSSYPPPPPPTNADPAAAGALAVHGGGPASTLQPLDAEADGDTSSAQDDHDLDHAAFSDAVAAAHHGLQALQAAIAAPSHAQSGSSPPPDTASLPTDPHAAVAMTPADVGESPMLTPQYAPPAETHSAYLLPTDRSVPPPGPHRTPDGHPKVRRLRRACDMCSSRKVKCDETQPCRPCRELNVECTLKREMKRRGPPNKHAIAARAAKQQRIEPNIPPASHNVAEQHVPVVAPPPARLDAESIGLSWPALIELINAFFTYIHPLAPFPHEPTFRDSLARREDRTNREFLTLLASMVGCLVASFPRIARLHLKTQQPGMLSFPRAINLIDRCRVVALQARGADFYSKEDITIYDAAASYFLGLTAGYTMQWKVCRRHMAETMSFIREMGYHKPREVGTTFSVTYRGPPFDHVQDQMGKRIFWCMFVGIRSMIQLGAPFTEIVLPPPTPNNPYPELPAEVDDEYILPSQILGQPAGTLSLITGFNVGVRIYMTMDHLVAAELAYGIVTFDFAQQRSVLEEALQGAKQVMENLPTELSLNLDEAPGAPPPSNLGPELAQTSVYDEATGSFVYCPAPYPLPPQQPPPAAGVAGSTRRLFQYEIQKANVYASQLATRSYYVERYLNLRDASRQEQYRAAGVDHHHHHHMLSMGDATDHTGGDASMAANKDMAAAALHAVAEQQHQQDLSDEAMLAERELIVKNLLTVLASINQNNMEPNGASLINKIRQVASTLINAADDRKGPVAMKVQGDLSRFVEILVRLERSGAGGGSMPLVPASSGLHGLHQGMAGGLFRGGPGGVGVGGMDGGIAGDDEEQELRNWADLREHQMKFVQGGGFMTHV